MKKLLASIVVGLSILAGCAGLTDRVKDNPILVKTSVQLATVEYLKYHPKRTLPMEQNVLTVKTLVESGQLGTVDLAAARIKELIMADKSLIPEEVMLANNIVDLFAMEAKEILEAQGYANDDITDENKETAIQVLNWILDAVNLMKAYV